MPHPDRRGAGTRGRGPRLRGAVSQLRRQHAGHSGRLGSGAESAAQRGASGLRGGPDADCPGRLRAVLVPWRVRGAELWILVVAGRRGGWQIDPCCGRKLVSLSL